MINKTLVVAGVSIVSGALMAIGFHLGNKVCAYCESPKCKEDIKKAADFLERVGKNVTKGVENATGSFVNKTVTEPKTEV